MQDITFTTIVASIKMKRKAWFPFLVTCQAIVQVLHHEYRHENMIFYMYNFQISFQNLFQSFQ